MALHACSTVKRLEKRRRAVMAESDWDTVTVLRKKGPTAAQSKSKQVMAARRGSGLSEASIVVFFLTGAPCSPSEGLTAAEKTERADWRAWQGMLGLGPAT